MNQPVVSIRARIEIRQLLKRLGEMKKTVIVSSHILPELADVCTRVGMIEKGQMIVDGYVADVMREARKAILLHVRVADRTDAAAALLEQHHDVESLDRKGPTVIVRLREGVEDYSFLPSLLIEAGFRLTLFREEEINLETAFMELTKGVQQ